MWLGRFISALVLATMVAFAAQPASAQRRAQFRPPKAPPQRQEAKGTTNKPGPKPGNANAQHPAGGGGGANANSRHEPDNPNSNSSSNRTVARPPNEQLFKPNPNVVHPGGASNAQSGAGGMRNLPGPWIQRLGEKSPEEQERFMQNNRDFQNLPPERQAQIRRNLQKWNSLSPAQKDQMIHGEQVLERLTPQQRQLYQNNILPRWQQMSPDRRQLINGRLHTLQAMPPAAQERALNDPRFMQGLTPDEQGVLRDLNSLRPPRP